MISLADLFTSLTPDQVRADLYTLADTVGLATTAWQKLSPLRSTYAVLSFLFSGLTRTQAAVNRARFLEGAEGDLLTLLAHYGYGVDRDEATFAPGFVQVSNAGGGLYSYGIGDLVVLNSSTNKSYRNTAPVTINPLQTGVQVAIEALEAGAASTAAPGQIDSIVAASPQLSVTNADSVVGQDAEQDPPLRVRCTDKLGALSVGGPAKAFAYFAKSKVFNGGVDVTRTIALPALGDGTIRIVIAGPNGVVTGTTGDPTSELGKVFLALNLLAVTAGYTLLLSSASAHSVTPSATVYIAASSGLSSADAIAAATFATTTYVPTIPIGGVDVGAGGAVLFRALEAAMKAAAPGILEAKLSSEADVALTATEVATLGAFTITPVQVAGA